MKKWLYKDVLKKYKLRLFFRMIIFLVWFSLFLYSFVKNNSIKHFYKNWDVVFILDISNSMNVKDVFYNNHQVSRLTLAKKIIEKFIKNSDRNTWLILFSDKFDYFIPPTLDKENFLVYLNTVNTNNLDGWKSNFVYSLNNSFQYLNPTDTVIVISDFDIDKSLVKLNKWKISYVIWLWKNTDSPVLNKDWKKIYINWQILTSKLWLNNIKNIWKKVPFDIYDSFWKDDSLKFLEKLKKYNKLNDKSKQDLYYITWVVLILLAL